MILNMIAAVSWQTGAIGLFGKLPWKEPADLKMFRKATDNSYIIVGKRTAADLPPLPNRSILEWDGRVDPKDFLQSMDLVGIRAAWLCGGAYTYEKFAPFVNGLRLISYIDYEGPFDKTFPFSAYGLPEILTPVGEPAW